MKGQTNVWKKRGGTLANSEREILDEWATPREDEKKARDQNKRDPIARY